VTIDKTKVLGRGGRSVVYAGILFGLADVVVKVAVCTAQDNTLAKVEDETRRANHSRHRNVAHVFGIVMLENYTVGVVMERLGVSLENTKVPNLSMRMKYTLDIIAGMEHTHSVDPLVHFGLNPANIRLTQDGDSVKIVTFKVTTHAVVQKVGYFCARRTVPFMAPKFFTDRSLSAPCNVYAFAVVVAELWTGTVAWKDVECTSMVDNVKSGRRPFSPCELSAKGVPASIIALIVACWKPEHRPTFRQLGEILTIPNFHLAPQEAWPSFLRAASSGLP
jgi:serine/threonine protein kinase